MSLVNDMLRDLEARRAAPGERLQLEGLQPVDEESAARRERNERIHRGLVWLAAVILGGVLVGLMLGRLFNPNAAQLPMPAAPVAAVPAPPVPQVLDVLPQHDQRGLVLQVLLDHSVTYQRTEESGAVSLRLPGFAMPGGTQQGRLQNTGRSLSWRVEPQGNNVQILLVGLGNGLDVRDRLEAAGDRWVLWIEVPLDSAPAAEAALDLDDLPAAEAEAPVNEPSPPAWANKPVAPANTASAKPARGEVPTPAKPTGPPQVRIAPYQPDALSLARQALQDGNPARAISDLEALNKTRPDDPEVARWLARAYLAGNQRQRLLDWAPEQLRRRPDNSGLRLLLARAQLQGGEPAGAISTLEQHAPPLLQEPTYFALLAATYQQAGQWRESAGLYRRLVELRPTEATWQLGLAIALDQQEQPQEARRHYLLALRGSGLEQHSRQFASERAQALGR
ncbi:tetratricopeptide repeat protein [Pseudomonas sp. LRF_L74]|uniref:tetratricopeptide repeat protein n=1 Tax=Pseudomonas sp. LRF_L74 TaxID=3369422 RepID=UPI003F637657